MPVGGVSLDNTADFIRAGANAVGIGSALVSQKLLEAGDFATLTERARRLCQEVAKVREA